MSEPRVDRFYAREHSLHVAIYDAMHAAIPGGDDTAFFRELAADAGGPALELGCGTGRLTIPLAEAGLRVTGLDRSPAMLSVAQAKHASLPTATRRRLDLVEGDMAAFDLGRRRYGLVFAAFRVFMSALTVDAQRAVLACARTHLRPGGILAIDVFDPLLDRVVPGEHPPEERGEYRHPARGTLVRVTAISRRTDPITQRIAEQWRFSERARGGRVVREEHEQLELRWTHRHEMQHLLELAGFDVLAEYSDYAKSPPAYGKEQIWVARTGRPVVTRRSAAIPMRR